MEIKYKLDTEDFINFNLYHIEFNEAIKKQLQKQRIVGSVLILLVGLVMAYFAKNSQMIIAVAMILMAGFWYLNFPRTVQGRIRKSTEKGIKNGQLANLLHEITINISEDGVEESNEETTFNTKWENIKQYVTINNYLYLFLENNNAILIPKRALDIDQLEDLDNLIRSNYKKEIVVYDF